jgi:hypothetical protein
MRAALLSAMVKRQGEWGLDANQQCKFDLG